jgi:hypothetical protein
MTTLLADIRFGARMLLKSPMVTGIALLALTLGIGANTAIFSVVNAVLLRSFPYTNAERLVLVWEKRQGGRTDQNVINLGNFSDWKEQNQVSARHQRHSWSNVRRRGWAPGTAARHRNQLRLVATPLRWRHPDRRAPDHSQRETNHDRRRDARELRLAHSKGNSGKQAR